MYPMYSWIAVSVFRRADHLRFPRLPPLLLSLRRRFAFLRFLLSPSADPPSDVRFAAAAAVVVLSRFRPHVSLPVPYRGAFYSVGCTYVHGVRIPSYY